MDTENDLKDEAGLPSPPCQRYNKKMNADGPSKNYHRATLRNNITGQEDEVVLFDPQDEANDALLATDVHLELNADLKAALGAFTTLEQRVLRRVLIEGYTIDKATARMKHSGATWRRWLDNVALPKLRALLAEYVGEARGQRSPRVIDLQPVADIPPARTDKVESVKCRFCSVDFAGKGESAFRKLRRHVAETHKEEFSQVTKHVVAHDIELQRAKKEFI